MTALQTIKPSHPPVFTSATKRSKKKIPSLKPIDKATPQNGALPDVEIELDRLEAEGDIAATVALYEAYKAACDGFLLLQNQPRTGYDAADFLQLECDLLWSKAFAVADRLKRMAPKTENERFQRSQTLFNACLQMGNRLEDAISVLNEID